MAVTSAVDLSEMRDLVIGFFQATIKDFPNGMHISQFEKKFPDLSDESPDWYKRYGFVSPLRALEALDAVNIRFDGRYNATFVELNTRSEGVDTHILNLVAGQRASNKKKRSGPIQRPNSRAQQSFLLNNSRFRPPSGSYSNQNRIRANQDYSGRRSNDYFSNAQTPQPSMPPTHNPPSIYNYVAPNARIAQADPRLRSQMVPPQVRQVNLPPSHAPGQHLQQHQQPKQLPSSLVSTPTRSPSTPESNNSFSLPTPRPTKLAEPTPVRRVDDPTMNAKKSHLAQRIQSLLTTKFAEIKLIHLPGIYKICFDEEIKPSRYGHETWTELIKDPFVSEYIQLEIKVPFPIIKARRLVTMDGKENMSFVDQLRDPEPTADSLSASEGVAISNLKPKFETGDPFNIKTMLLNLEPVGDIKGPKLDNKPIDESVKYKTMRMIYKSPNQTFKIDDWEVNFEKESRLRIRIREYGCTTKLEFFKKLAQELPITIKLKDDIWVATVNIEALQKWIIAEIEAKRYRSITCLDKKFELIAFPNDQYIFRNSKDLASDEHQPAIILSVDAKHIWIQLRTPKRIEEHLCAQESMNSYEDYKERDINRLSIHFVQPGLPCAVYDRFMQRWCRALLLKTRDVVSSSNVMCKILLVDYGVIREVPVSELRCLMRAHLKLPVGPIYSKLDGIVDEDDEGVQRRAKRILQEYTSPPVTLACKFISESPIKDLSNKPPEEDSLDEALARRVRNCMTIELVDTRHGRDCRLADDINLLEFES